MRNNESNPVPPSGTTTAASTSSTSRHVSEQLNDLDKFRAKESPSSEKIKMSNDLHQNKEKEAFGDEDIIVKCSLDEMVKQFFKEYVAVWHDPNVDCPENQKYLAQLGKLCEVKAFKDWEKASEYIREAKTSCHVITAGTNGESLVKEICMYEHVSEIYVFCQNIEYHSSWARNYEKVASVVTDIGTILEQVQKILLQWYKRASSLKITLPAFAPIFNDRDKSDMNQLHRHLKAISLWKNRLQAKRDFMNLSKAIYMDEANMKFIAEFEKDYNEYSKNDILRWYTQECFLYKVANNCLRMATSDSIQYCRMVLQDLQKAIQEQYQQKSKQFNGLLYRGAYLSEQEWSSLKENVDREIEMHGFLSVSKVKNVGLNFLKTDPSKKAIITIIVPKGPNDQEQGFAEMEEFSEYVAEREVLFNVRSRFTVLETEDFYSKDLPYRHLVLLYGAQSFRKFIAENNPMMKIEDIKSVVCCRCQKKMNEIPDAKIFFTSLTDRSLSICKGCLKSHLKVDNTPLLCVPIQDASFNTNVKGSIMEYPKSFNVPFYGYKCHKCQEKKCSWYFKCTECCSEGKEKRFCEDCMEELMTNCAPKNHAIILESVPFSFWCGRMSEGELSQLRFQEELFRNPEDIFRQAKMYFENQQFQKAREYYNIYLQRNEKDPQNPYIAFVYCSIGRMYFMEGEEKKALECFLKCVEIKKSVVDKTQHPPYEEADAYENIALIYSHQGEYKKALEYGEKSLELMKMLFGENHVKTVDCNNTIATIYLNQRDYKKALEHLLRCLEMLKILHGYNHPNVGACYSNLGFAYDRLGELQNSLNHYWNSLEIAKAVHGEKHTSVGTAYKNIGELLITNGEFAKALDFYWKALEIYELTYGKDHPNTGLCYDSIGCTLVRQGDLVKGREYLLKALEIFQSNYGEKHLLAAKAYQNIAHINYREKAYRESFEYYSKALEIKKLAFGVKNVDVALMNLALGKVCYRMGEFEKALTYLFESLNIFQSFSVHDLDAKHIQIKIEKIERKIKKILDKNK